MLPVGSCGSAQHLRVTPPGKGTRRETKCEQGMCCVRRVCRVYAWALWAVAVRGNGRVSGSFGVTPIGAHVALRCRGSPDRSVCIVRRFLSRWRLRLNPATWGLI